MVLNLRWCFRLGAIAATFALGGIVSAQSPAPNSLPELQQRVSQRSAEWNTLATNLEQRVARLLPCDPQARTAIDEVSRASDARLVALTNYWTLASLQSRTQIEPIRRLLAQEEDRASDWTADANQVQVDAALTAARGASLAMSVPQLPAMANPQKILQDIAGQYRSLEKQAQERAGGESRLLVDLRELLNTSQARQAAIDQRMKTVAAEGQRWSAYYAARQARAQVECSLINSAAGTGPAAVPRPTPQRKKP